LIPFRKINRLVYEFVPNYLYFLMSTIEEEKEPKPKNKQYRKDKPWDNPSIDHWKVEPIKPEEVQPFLEESSFSVLFPQYREKYIQECQGIIKKRLMEAGVKF
jgi:ribosomal RNA assembly protein